MAVRLIAWLEDTFEEQLLLGNNWLQGKHKINASGPRTAYAREWRELYHDNGSCLDILNQFDCTQHSALLVLQSSPLILTDGRCQLRANLTTDCVYDFSARFPSRSFAAANTLIAVRRYTIQYTSYGPPNARLRFILRAVDWLGVLHQQGPPEPWSSLLGREEIRSVLHQLDNTRACEDSRCLQGAADVKAEDEDMGGLNDDTDGGVPLGGDSPQTQLAYTQLPFGTQLEHPTQPQKQRVEALSNTAKPESENRNKLLSLLNRTGFQSVQKTAPSPATDHVQQTASSRNISVEIAGALGSEKTEEAKSQPPKRPKERDHVTGSAVATARIRNIEEVSSRPESDGTPTKKQKKRAVKDDKPEDTVLPDWMKGFTFDREALKVPVNQQIVLGHPTSWHHPQPGSIGFPSGNIPITILEKLSRIADEKAAEEGLSDTDSDANFDPTPDSFPTASHKQSQEPILPTSQSLEPTTSQVSWSCSPEPPVRPAMAQHGLPPDSSFVDRISIENSPSKQQHAETLSTQHPTLDRSFGEKEPSPPPPSSPPRNEYPIDSDDEMEMEASVPQALGEDVNEVTYEEEIQSSLPNAHSSGPKPFVQVEETPNAKDRHDKGAESMQNQKLSGSPKNTSSTSIVFGTYKDKHSSDAIQSKEMPNNPKTGSEQEEGQKVLPSVEDFQNQGVNPQDAKSTLDDAFMVDDLPDAKKEASLGVESIDSTRGVDALLHPQDVDIFPEALLERHENSAPGPLSDYSLDLPAMLPSPKHLQTQSGIAKRKLEESPTKGGRRHSKRRELKIADWADEPPDVKPSTLLDQERKEAFRRFRDNRKQKTEKEIPPLPIDHAKHTDKMTLSASGTRSRDSSARAMSPRHRSLYEGPTFVKPESILPKSPSLSSPMPVGRQPSIPAPQVLKIKDSTTPAQAPLAVAADHVASGSIFLAFKAAYPEYTGDAKHFQGQCTQMFKLYQEDKMVPKWQWDDFIIRNRTDYKDYALECVNSGENPEPYHRFYKNTIRDTFYRKGIMQSTTLLKALEEFGVDCSLPVPKAQPQNHQPRFSLPSISSRQKKSVPEAVTTPRRPRHSLPASSNKATHTYEESPSNYQSRSASRPLPLSQAESTSSRSKQRILERLNSGRLSNPRASIGPESAHNSRDIHRDYYFATQRLTSLTGSTEVNRSKPWPDNLAVRPSIEDTPKCKVDVLTWRDEL